jgi:hypothetical protein
MHAAFLLRYQERYLSPEEAGLSLKETTYTKVLGEGTDRAALPTTLVALPAATTKTAIKGEGPDRSFDPLSATALPRSDAVSAKETLTYTFVHSEAPRNDDNRQGGLKVLPRAADHH